MITLIRRIIFYMFSVFFRSITGICHVIILSVLGLAGIITGLFTLLMPIFGLLRFFGAEEIFIVTDNIQVPSMLGVPTGIFLGIICASLSWLSFRALMKYFQWISKNEYDVAQ